MGAGWAAQNADRGFLLNHDQLNGGECGGRRGFSPQKQRPNDVVRWRLPRSNNQYRLRHVKRPATDGCARHEKMAHSNMCGSSGTDEISRDAPARTRDTTCVANCNEDTANVVRNSY
jgi:hypothetical protein